jgi:lipid-A-disaccharide synthase
MMVAAEASSSLYALRLIQHWKLKVIRSTPFGIGDRAMEGRDLRSLAGPRRWRWSASRRSWRTIREFAAPFSALLDEASRRRPKVVILLDYPEFNLRLAKRLKRLDIPVVYYISPQIWAWRTSRVNIVRANVDKMLVIFPFEKDFYEKHDTLVEFVGHPLLDELFQVAPSPDEIASRRAELGFKPADLVLALMPGSRRSEIRHHLADQVETARKLKLDYPDLKVVLFVAPTLDEDEIRAQVLSRDIDMTFVKDEPLSMIALADVVLCASGTATLQVGLMQKPMVIMYRMSPLTVFLARWLIRRPTHFGLINLILDERVVPELFQDEASPDAMARALAPLIRSADARREMSARLARARHVLGERGATGRVTAALQPYLDRP